MNYINVGKTIKKKHLGIVSIPPIYGDDWGMVDDCFTHIIDHIDNDLHPIILMIANDTIWMNFSQIWTNELYYICVYIYIVYIYIYCIYVKYGRVSLQRHFWVASFAARLSTTLFLLSTWSQKQRGEQCDPPAATSMKYCLVRKQSQLKNGWWSSIV